MIYIDALPTSHVNDHAYRIIPARYPQISLFERVSGPEHWDLLYAVEALTNLRLRDEVGDIRLVAPQDRVYGDAAFWIMAAFTHPPMDGRGGRFNKDFGIYLLLLCRRVSGSCGIHLPSSALPQGSAYRTAFTGNAYDPRPAEAC